MAKYEVKKVSVSSWNPDGSKVYEYGFEYSTWAELISDMAYRDKNANVIYMGKGADIFRDGELIGNTADLIYAANESGGYHTAKIRAVSLRLFLENSAQ